jgi:hypothetical protein
VKFDVPHHACGTILLNAFLFARAVFFSAGVAMFDARIFVLHFSARITPRSSAAQLGRGRLLGTVELGPLHLSIRVSALVRHFARDIIIDVPAAMPRVRSFHFFFDRIHMLSFAATVGARRQKAFALLLAQFALAAIWIFRLFHA